MKEEIEIWKDVVWPVDLTGLYQVSNMGRIKSLKNHNKVKDGILKPYPDDCKYLQIDFWKGKRISKKLHKVVGNHFVPNPDNKPEINHKFGIKEDNRASQLEWCTRKENNRHALATGLRVALKGEQTWNSKLTKEDVLYARELYKSGNISYKQIANKYGVAKKTMMSAISGKTWKHI